MNTTLCLTNKTVLDSFLITKQAPSYEYMRHHFFFYNCATLKTKYFEGLRLRFAVALENKKKTVSAGHAGPFYKLVQSPL